MTDVVLDAVKDAIDVLFFLALALVFLEGTEPIPWLGLVWLVMAVVRGVHVVMYR